MSEFKDARKRMQVVVRFMWFLIDIGVSGEAPYGAASFTWRSSRWNDTTEEETPWRSD